MAANTLLVLLGALSIAGVGVGAATLSEMPCGGPYQGSCGANGCGPNGQAGGHGCHGVRDADRDQAGNGTCPLADDGLCPYANGTAGSR